MLIDLNRRQQLEELEVEVGGASGPRPVIGFDDKAKKGAADSDDSDHDEDEDGETGDWRKLKADLDTDLRINEV